MNATERENTATIAVNLILAANELLVYRNITGITNNRNLVLYCAVHLGSCPLLLNEVVVLQLLVGYLYSLLNLFLGPAYLSWLCNLIISHDKCPQHDYSESAHFSAGVADGVTD